MLPYYRYQYVDSSDYMLYRYVKSGQVKKATEILTKICRSRSLTRIQIKELLRAAVQTNDASMLQLIIDQGAVLHRESPSELSALWIAVLLSHHNSAELLIRSGADVNELLGAHAMYDGKSTILHVLLHQSVFTSWNDRLINFIIDHGANLLAQDSKGRSVLHIAITMDNLRLTELFLEKGADVNAVDNKGETPLLAAAQTFKFDKFLSLLMEYGADITLSDRLGRNILHQLCSRRIQCVDVARIFIEKGASLDQRELYKQYQPIHFAATNGTKEIIKLCLDHGADVNARAKNGVFPLYLSAQSNAPIVLETLLERGAKIDMRTDNGRTVLHNACYNHRQKNIWLLLSAGADILAEDNEGYTPFSLIEHNSIINLCTKLMLKELALKKTCQPLIELKDEKIIVEDLDLWDYYQDCINEVASLKVKRFINTCTFFKLLTENHYQIAQLMRNPKFKTNFSEYDLSEFPEYSEHLLRAFERAEYCYHFMLEQEDFIDKALFESCPYLIVRQIACYMCPEHIFNDFCENQK